MSTGARRWRLSMAGRRGCPGLISILGRAPKGCAAGACWLRTSRDSGSRWDTTTTATPGRNSATPATSGAPDGRGAMAVIPPRLAWQRATVQQVLQETPNVKSLVLEVPGWAGHSAGQHLDVRLTAADGYQAERSYSIASAPADAHVTLTVERLDDGEVSPYLTDELRPSDELEVRGPIGGWFTGAPPDGAPPLL